MDGVVDKNDVLVTVNKVHDRFGGVAAEKGGEKHKICMDTRVQI